MQKRLDEILEEKWETTTIADVAKKDHSRIDPSGHPEKTFNLYSFSAYDEGEEPKREQGSEIGSAKYQVKSSCILLSKLNPRINRVWKVENPPEDAICSTEFIVLVPDKQEMMDFLYTVCRSPQFRSYLQSLTTGTSGSHQRVKQKDVFNYEFSRPADDKECVQIGRTLTNFDRRIDANEKINNLLAEMSQTIFKNWFMEFNPFPEDQLVYHDGLGIEIPEGWDVHRLSDVAKIVDCLHSKKPDENEDGEFYIEVNDIGENGELYLDNQYRISKVDYGKWTRRITARPGDIIISKDGRVGDIAQIPEGIEGAIGRNLVCIRPDQENLSPELLREYMLSPLMKQEIGKKTLSRSIFDTLHVSEIEDLRILLPPTQTRKEFDNLVRPVHRQIEHNIKESINLGKARDTLLPKLLSREVHLDPRQS